MSAKLSELFSPELNVWSFGADNKSLVSVWNNQTLLNAEIFSDIFFDDGEKSAQELIELQAKGNRFACLCLLFSSIVQNEEHISINEFLCFFQNEKIEECIKTVQEGMMQYLPTAEIQNRVAELQQLVNADEPNYLDDSDSGVWVNLYYFAKKQIGLSDEEFLDSTWRKLFLLLIEHLKSSPKYNENRIQGAENVDI